MPTWDKILKEANELNPVSLLEKYIESLGRHTGRTTICYMSAFSVIRPYPVPTTHHSIIDQDMQGFMTCSSKVNKEALDLVIHTPGGTMRPQSV